MRDQASPYAFCHDAFAATARSQRKLLLLFLFQDPRALDALLLAFQPLEGVLERSGWRVRAPRRFSARPGERGERIAPGRPDLFLERIADVALIADLGDGEQPIGRARIPGEDDEFVLGDAASRPAQVMLGARRLAVLVGAQERHVEVVPRET